MLCIVGRKRLYYCFPASAGNPRPVCIGAVRLDHLDIAAKLKTVKKQKWAILELKAIDKKQQFYSARGPSGEPLKYPKSKSRSSHLYLKHIDEGIVQEWKSIILEQSKLPPSAEPADDGDPLSEASESQAGGNDQTSLDLSDEEEFSDEERLESESVIESTTQVASSPQMRGHLEMRDLQTWNKRFFKIDGTHGRNVLSFFRGDKNFGEEEILGVIKLEKAMAVVPISLDDDVPKKREKGEKYYSFRLYHTQHRRIFSLTKRDGTKLHSTRDHGNASDLFLRTPSLSERNAWVQSIADVIKNTPAKFTESVPLIPPDVPFEPTHFFNLLMARNWEDMVSSEVLKKNIRNMIEKQIAELQLPKFITQLVLKKLDVGTRFFDFLSMRYRTIIHPEFPCPEIVADIQVAYHGGLAIELALEVRVFFAADLFLSHLFSFYSFSLCSFPSFFFLLLLRIDSTCERFNHSPDQRSCPTSGIDWPGYNLCSSFNS